AFGPGRGSAALKFAVELLVAGTFGDVPAGGNLHPEAGAVDGDAAAGLEVADFRVDQGEVERLAAQVDRNAVGSDGGSGELLVDLAERRDAVAGLVTGAVVIRVFRAARDEEKGDEQADEVFQWTNPW